MSAPVHYGSYLNLERILGAQNPPGPDGAPRPLAHHDEMLFVLIHQVYELWFKQMLHELVRVRDILGAERVPEEQVPVAVKSLRRVHEIQKVLVQQLGVLETMSPSDFLAFRDELGSASGFQSAQFRELEILAGLEDEVRYDYAGESFDKRFPAEEVARFEALRTQPSLKESLTTWLARTPFEDDFVARYQAAFDEYVEGQRALHRANADLDEAERGKILGRLDDYAASCRTFLSGDDAHANAACLFIAAYRHLPLLHWPNRLLDSLLEFEELWRLWRFRHARMVERMIGLRVGTGGSSGVEYLDATAGDRYRIFTVVLESRSLLLPPRLLPALRDAARYGFVRDQV